METTTETRASQSAQTKYDNETYARATASSHRPHREVTFALDKDGAAIVLIPTNQPGRTVKMLADDWHAYIAKGYSSQIFLCSNGRGLHYVRVGCWSRKGNLAMVARLMLDAPGGVLIGYADGNRLNLRRDNLTVNRKPRPERGMASR